jgi:hypothetical protein
LAYERDTFVGGSSVFSLSSYEVQVWDYYHTYIQRSKIDRLEIPSVMGAYFSGVNKVRGKLKMNTVKAEPLKPKKSAMDLFSRGRFFKPKKKAK